jgi:putative effector of murein hydrolase
MANMRLSKKVRWQQCDPLLIASVLLVLILAAVTA